MLARLTTTRPDRSATATMTTIPATVGGHWRTPPEAHSQGLTCRKPAGRSVSWPFRKALANLRCSFRIPGDSALCFSRRNPQPYTRNRWSENGQIRWDHALSCKSGHSHDPAGSDITDASKREQHGDRPRQRRAPRYKRSQQDQRRAKHESLVTGEPLFEPSHRLSRGEACCLLCIRSARPRVDRPL